MVRLAKVFDTRGQGQRKSSIDESFATMKNLEDWILDGNYHNRKPGKQESKEMDMLNNMTEKELQDIPGIGKSLAHQICRSIENTGPYINWWDVRLTGGIGSRRWREIQSYIQSKG